MIWEVLGIPMGKNKLESDSPRDQDAVDRENFEMSKGRIGLVEVIEDDDNEDENEKDTQKRKLREVGQL
ncbi:hypothetical protein Tco_0865684 [Tanacetum coccineum]